MKRKITLLAVLSILVFSMAVSASPDAKSSSNNAEAQADARGSTISQSILGAIGGLIGNDKDPNNSPIESKKTEKSNSDSSANTDGQVNDPSKEKKDRVEDALSASARKGRNPQTGKEIKIPAKKVVKFKPGAELSEKVKMAGPGNSTDTDNLYMVELAETDEKKALDAFIDTTTKIVDTDSDGAPDEVRVRKRSTEQGEYREGNDASHEKKMWGYTTFDDLEMERGVAPEEAGYETGEEFTVKFGNTEVEGYSVKVKTIAGNQNRVLVSAAGGEYSPPELDASADGDMARTDGGKEKPQRGKMVSKSDLEEPSSEGGKTVGAGQVTEIIELAGDGNSKALKKGNRVALALNDCNSECIDRLTEVAAEHTGNDVPVEEVSADRDTATESVTVAFDEMIRTEAARPNSSDGESREMERGTKPGETKLHDWNLEVQASKADEGRKEIAVKLLNEEGQTQTRWDYTEEQVADEVSSEVLQNGQLVIEMNGEEVGKIPTEELDLSTEMVDRHGPMKTGRFEIGLTKSTGGSDDSSAEFKVDGESAMADEEITIAYDKMVRAE